jgi:hypothetical protein
MTRILCVVLLCISGCATAFAENPAAVYERYRDLLAHQHYDDAWRMLSPESRARIDAKTFAGQQASRTTPARTGPVALAATLPTGSEVVTLHLVDAHWLIDERRGGSDTDASYRQDEPIATLRSFVRAVGERRYDVVFQFVPPDLRARTSASSLRAAWEGPEAASLHAELAQLDAQLATAHATVTNHHAMVRWANHDARLVETDGVWTIDRLH